MLLGEGKDIKLCGRVVVLVVGGVVWVQEVDHLRLDSVDRLILNPQVLPDAFNEPPDLRSILKVSVVNFDVFH